MDINNIQALIAQGLITDVASVDPNKAYVAVGVYQPGNRQSGPAGNAYPSYAMPISEFLSGAGVLTGAQNGLSLAGTVAELGGTLIHTTDVNINGYSMQFSNGVYPILFLDPGKQQVAIGGNNPRGMLDITAVGSGTVGLQLNTASTQDAKIHFRTNNAAAARAQVYVEDVSQTLNFYTNTNNTIFWNGNGGVQTKTFTLFTDTTAKFENNIGIGADPVTNGRVQINNSVFGKASISLGGADYYGIDVNTTGLSMLLGVNTSNNKQLWLADQDKLASNGTNPVLQFGLFGTSPSAINALSTNGTNLNLVLQSNGGNVGINTGVVNPTARLHVKGNSAPGDFTFKAEDAGGNPLLYVRNDGYTTIMDMVVGRGGGLISTNTVLGVAAIANATGGQNTGVGYAVLNTLNTGTGNTAIGYAVLANITSGTTNVGIGASVMQASNPSYSIGIGSGVLYQSSGTGNTGIGHGNFYNLSLGDYNTALGYNAGANVMHTQGNNNLFLGYMADVSTNNLTNASAIGANATVGASNSMVLGNGVNVGIGSSTPTSKLQVVGLPTYADNTAASGAGLTVGAMYIRTGHGLDIVV